MSELFTILDRKGTACLKWDRCNERFGGEDLLPLWIADTDFTCPKEVTEAITKRCEHPIFGYSMTPADYIPSVINWFSDIHDLTLKPEWIAPVCGVLTAISYTIQTVTAPDDPVLIQPPVYDPFSVLIRGTGRTITESPLLMKDNAYSMDYENLEQAFQNGVKAMILCNPHNPVGRVWTRDEIKRLVDLCVKYQVYLIADEIHCDFALFDHTYTSVLAFPEIHPYAVSCNAPAKTFNISGLNIGNLMVPNEELLKKITEKMRSAWLLKPDILALIAAEAAYHYGEDWMNAQKKFLEENSLIVQNYLKKEMPHIHMAPHEGTFLLWLDFHEFPISDEQLNHDLVHLCHLGMNAGSSFGKTGDHFIRLNIGCSHEMLEEALKRLKQFHDLFFSQERS